MNLLMEFVVDQGFVLDLFGILGLGLLAFAAIRLSRRMSGIYAGMMVWGALAMMLGRISFLFIANMVDPVQLASLPGHTGDLIKSIPTVLLTFGLASIVLGFWSHERDTSELAESV